ncbi:hypothetical protein IMCC14465_01930 [alpha proteobacterium IMCC14465]|uniref:N-acetyl-gamma-glutamyl-phosphate reductase n=1 Tax=alpha proteobacterium IMCC14465 TaxID=1220535 RepID=J9E1K6_9PROT|nr:hypothetical protein IMCC14465_01930 [alpha proteobacterium IMCC14465]
MEKIVNVVIIGASGYTGADAIRLLSEHPFANITALTAHQHAGKNLSDIYPQFASVSPQILQTTDEIDWSNVDIAICGLPHGTSQKLIAAIPDTVKIIDMSADFRLKNQTTYQDWYGLSHDFPDLLSEAVYGLSEHYAEAIASSRLVACPGCYPTAVLTALLPVIKAGQVSCEDLIIDAKSGVTGAGRSLKEANLFSEIAEGLAPYGIARHRHAPEIEQELGLAAGLDNVTINFTPHLVPMNRGELVTIYAKTNGANADDMRSTLAAFYNDKPFVTIVGENETPATRHVRGSNYCHVGVYQDRVPNRVILVATLDNLVKGSSGQAVQNLNLMCGFDETSGLTQLPLYP